jgi:DNA repair exonuclease SbcCD ATPase subunit
MWYPISLQIKNLFSHQESSFNFQNNQITTVYGVNKTDLNVLSNGSGKTSILDCISIALLGEPLRDISKKEIVRNGEKFGQCQLILHNDVLKKRLIINREIHTTKSSDCHIYENDLLNTSLKDLEVKETDKYILGLLGINKEDLRNYFLISKDSYQSFFLNGDTAKKEIINRFSKANIIDGVEPLIKEDISLLDKTIDILKAQLTSNNGVLSHLDQELNKEQLDSSIEQTRQLTIKSLEDRKEFSNTIK